MLLEPFGCEVCAYVDPGRTNAYLRQERVEPMGLRHSSKTSRVIFVLATPTSENEALLSRERPRRIAPRRRPRPREPRPRRRFRGALPCSSSPGASVPRSTSSRRSPSPRSIRSAPPESRALAAPGRAGAGGALEARADGRRRPRGDDLRPAAAPHAGRRAGLASRYVRTTTFVADPAGAAE